MKTILALTVILFFVIMLFGAAFAVVVEAGLWTYDFLKGQYKKRFK